MNWINLLKLNILITTVIVISQKNILGQNHRMSILGSNYYGYFDLPSALSASKRINKPIFIFFTGFDCVFCRKMQLETLSQCEVKSTINKEFISLWLYMDDDTCLEKPLYDKGYKNGPRYLQSPLYMVEQLNTWILFERFKVRVGSLPCFLIIDGNENIISEPLMYTTDLNKVKKFLSKAISK